MGSLFRVSECWSTKFDDELGFGSHSLEVCNIDNSLDGAAKIVVGSLSGVLRLYEGTLASRSEQLLEVDMGLPILSVASGRLLPSSEAIHLLILHPRKVCVYSLSGTAGRSEHSSVFNILLIYEHILRHSAFSVLVGPFGQVKGKDLICVQSLDGTLSFFEQETFTFQRLLPNHLLPGPIAYCVSTDSFIVATSSRSIDSFRYQVLAITKDHNSSTDSQAGGVNRRVIADWSLVLGEIVIEIQVVDQEKRGSFVVVMGERNIFVAAQDGSPVFVKKMDFSPISLCAYVNDDNLMLVVVTELGSLLCFSGSNLKWAARMPFQAIALRRSRLSGVEGTLVALSDVGDLASCYLGTNPSPLVVSLASEPLNHQEAEQELEKLRAIMKARGDSLSLGKGSKTTAEQILINVKEATPAELSSDRETRKTGSVDRRHHSFKISLESDHLITQVRVTIDLPSPFEANQESWHIDRLLPQTPASLTFNLRSIDDSLPVTLVIRVIVVYMNPENVPRVATKQASLPLHLVASLVQNKVPATEMQTLDLVIVSGVAFRWNTLLPDVPGITTKQELTLELTNGDHVTLSSSSQSSLSRLGMASASLPTLALVAVEVIDRLRATGARFDVAALSRQRLPLPAFFRLIDLHSDSRRRILALKQVLAERVSQLRVTEKRFLIKLKDRNPPPLKGIDHLIAHVQSRVSATLDDVIQESERLNATAHQLGTVLMLMAHLVSLAGNARSEQQQLIKAVLHPFVTSVCDESVAVSMRWWTVDDAFGDTCTQGWEETMAAALSHWLEAGNKGRSQEARIANASDGVKVKQLLHQLDSRTWVREGGREAGTGDQVPATDSRSPLLMQPRTEAIAEEQED